MLVLPAKPTRIFLFAAYALLLAASSLYPFAWQFSDVRNLGFLWAPWPQGVTRIDLLTNVFVYVPLGFTAARAFFHHRDSVTHWLLVCLLGALFSTVMECLQLLVPHRVASNVDILANLAGTAIGAALAPFLSRRNRWSAALIVWRRHWFRPGWRTDLGLLLMLLWLLAQFSLQAPSLLAGSLHGGFTPVWEARAAPFKPGLTLRFALEIASLGLFASTLLRPERRRPAPLLAFVVATLLLKFLAATLLLKLTVVPRLLSGEFVLGFSIGTALLFGMCFFRPTATPFPQLAMALCIFILVKLLFEAPFLTATGSTPDLSRQAEYLLNIAGVAFLAAELWPFLALGYCLALWSKDKES